MITIERHRVAYIAYFVTKTEYKHQPRSVLRSTYTPLQPQSVAPPETSFDEKSVAN